MAILVFASSPISGPLVSDLSFEIFFCEIFMGNIFFSYYRERVVVSFFFFQAEDGIRDLYVTGVQTCALPISPYNDAGGPNSGSAYVLFGGASGLGSIDLGNLSLKDGFRIQGERFGEIAGISRSEERRVGKECRCRWSGCQ